LPFIEDSHLCSGTNNSVENTGSLPFIEDGLACSGTNNSDENVEDVSSDSKPQKKHRRGKKKHGSSGMNNNDKNVVSADKSADLPLEVVQEGDVAASLFFNNNSLCQCLGAPETKVSKTASTQLSDRTFFAFKKLCTNFR
jgi:hypothetical protein